MESESQSTKDLQHLSDDKTKEAQNGEPKYKNAVLAYSNATLGISMVVAVLIGVGIGYGLEKLFFYRWLFWLGVTWGVLAAILNVYKAYKRQLKEFDELKKDAKYAYMQKQQDAKKDDWDEED